MYKLKKIILDIIEPNKNNQLLSKIFDYGLITLILLNVLAIVAESFLSIKIKYNSYFEKFELISVIIFTIEYILRLWTSDIKYNFGKLKSRIYFIFTLLALIDLLAILPFYLPMLIKIDLRFIRILRLIRLFRIFKLNRYSSSINLIFFVIKKKKEELVSTLFLTFLLLMISSTLIYYIENEVQPDKFKNILASFWWAIATLTTVGYGDIYPITTLGKILSGFIALLGIGLVALPTGIISSGFIEQIKQKKENKNETQRCPHCGKKINKN
jgi:voltage-gated potassium channel